MKLYLSSEIAQRFTMLAVEHMTSEEIQILQKVWPKVQEERSLIMAKGMTTAGTETHNCDFCILKSRVLHNFWERPFESLLTNN